MKTSVQTTLLFAHQFGSECWQLGKAGAVAIDCLPYCTFVAVCSRFSWARGISCMDFGKLRSRDSFDSRRIAQRSAGLAYVNRHQFEVGGNVLMRQSQWQEE